MLDGEEEARLSFRSAVAHFDMGVGRTVVMDIGGGSLELALTAEGVIERLGSLPLGAIRLTETYFDKGVSPKAVRRMRRDVEEALSDEIPRRDWRGAQLIGSGGTFTNLAGIFLARQGILTARSVHAAHIPRAELEHILDVLADMSAEERRAVPGLNPERADIIVAGIAVAAEVLRRLESRELVVSRYGIREGLLLEAARVRPTIADPGEARARSVTEFATRCHVEQPHSSHVQKLALILFDAIGERLGCTKVDRDALADAALLHDCGYHISYERHHKHSYHLILHADMLGLAPSEQVVIANVARYHRGNPPRRQQRNFGMLDKSLRRRIKRLSAILRVADGWIAATSPPSAISRCAGRSARCASRLCLRDRVRRCASRCGARAERRGCSQSWRACQSRSSARTAARSRRTRWTRRRSSECHPERSEDSQMLSRRLAADPIDAAAIVDWRRRGASAIGVSRTMPHELRCSRSCDGRGPPSGTRCAHCPSGRSSHA